MNGRIPPWVIQSVDYPGCELAGSLTLVGLDAAGRGVYVDRTDFSRSMLVVVPKHHHAFQADISGDEQPVQEYSPRHGPAVGGDCVDGPNNDVLVVSDQEKLGWMSHTDLYAWVVETALAEEWSAIEEETLTEIEDRLSNAQDDDLLAKKFPIEKAQRVLDEFGW